MLRSTKYFNEFDIDYYRVFSRTSNVFCTNMDIYIEKAKKELGNEIIETAKKYVNYDNPIFSTGILFPRDKPAEFELGNLEAVKEAEARESVKRLVLEIGREVLKE